MRGEGKDRRSSSGVLTSSKVWRFNSKRIENEYAEVYGSGEGDGAQLSAADQELERTKFKRCVVQWWLESQSDCGGVVDDDDDIDGDDSSRCQRELPVVLWTVHVVLKFDCANARCRVCWQTIYAAQRR